MSIFKKKKDAADKADETKETKTEETSDKSDDAKPQKKSVLSKFANKDVEVTKKEGSSDPDHVPDPIISKKTQAKIKQYGISVISVGVFLFVLLIETFVSNHFMKVQHIYESKLGSMMNNISLMSQTEKKTKEIVRDVDADLDPDMWAADDKYFYNWVFNVFSYSTVDEYHDHRKEYLHDMGEDSYFANVVMPYFATIDLDYATEKDYNDNVMSHFSSRITQFKSSVIGIMQDEYTYLTFIDVEGERPGWDDVMKQYGAIPFKDRYACVYTVRKTDKSIENSSREIVNIRISKVYKYEKDYS